MADTSDTFDTFLGPLAFFIASSAIKMHWITIKMPRAVKGLTLGGGEGVKCVSLGVSLLWGGWPHWGKH